jgi:hypothetical protein
LGKAREARPLPTVHPAVAHLDLDGELDGWRRRGLRR